MKKVKIFCILLIIIGIALFICTYFYIPSVSVIFGWCIGMACSLVILGSGFLVNVMYHDADSSTPGNYSDMSKEYPKEKSGYLVCKIMSLILCIYILILEKTNVSQTILYLSIGLLVVQYLLNLILYLHFSRKKDN